MRSPLWTSFRRWAFQPSAGYWPSSLFALLLCAMSGAAMALDPARPVDEFTLTAWTMEDGLPHNYVHYIEQDAEGFLWVGTWEGAARFDGRRFDAFDKRILQDIPLAGVRTLLPEADGAMLFGTSQHGVVRYSHGRWSVLPDTFDARLRVVDLLRAADGGLWIGCEDGLFHRAPGGGLTRIGSDRDLPGGMVLSMLELPDGGLLIGTLRGLFLWREGQPFQALSPRLGLPEEAVRVLIRRRNGGIVLGDNYGAYAVDDGLARARRFLDGQIEAAHEDRHGALWLMTAGQGLVRDLDGRQEAIDIALGLKGRGGTGLFEDREGLIWIGTTNGLYRITDGPVFGLDRARGLGDDYPRSILRRDDGSMLIGHATGLDRWRDGAIAPVDLAGRASSVLTLASARDGGVYIGTYDRGMLHYPADLAPEGVDVVDAEDGLRSQHVRAIAESGEHGLFVGTSTGLAVFERGKMTQWLGAEHGLPGNFVRALLPSRRGGMWIGTANGLAHRAADGTLKAWHSGKDFPAVSSFDLLEDDEGALWIGSDSGLLRLREDGGFAVYDHRAGLPNDSIFRVLDDGNGSFWLSSNKGAFRIAKAQFAQVDAGQRQRLTVDAFDHSDGMPSSQCNGGNAQAGDFDARGRLWLPTATGVAVIDPDASLAQSRGAVQVKIEGVQLDAKALIPTSTIAVQPEVRRVTIHYAGLDFRAPLRIRYRYRMLGFDHDWVDADTATEAVYTNLPGGRLRFEVQAAMSPVDWNDAGLEPGQAGVDFEVIPPFWLRPWFALLAALALFGLLALLFRWRAARYRRGQERLHRTIELRTRELFDKNAALVQAGREREALLSQLEHQATHDALTGLPNRRAGDLRLAAAFEEAASRGQPLCVALGDIDHFKRVNDEYGHDIGDALLRHVAQTLERHETPLGGYVTRHGGEEFLFVLPDADLAQATRRMELTISHVAGASLEHTSAGALHVTISIGVAQWKPGMSGNRLIAAADRALYRAKREGRNKVVAET